MVSFVVTEHLNLRAIYGYTKVDVKMVDNEGIKPRESYDVLRHHVKTDHVKTASNVCRVHIISLLNTALKSNTF